MDAHRAAQFLVFAAVAGMVALLPELAWAGQPTNPFSVPLRNIMRIVTGPVAVAIAMAGILATGLMLVFGGEMKDFVKSMVTITLVVCVVIFSAQLVQIIFPSADTNFAWQGLNEQGGSVPFSAPGVAN